MILPKLIIMSRFPKGIMYSMIGIMSINNSLRMNFTGLRITYAGKCWVMLDSAIDLFYTAP